MYVSGVGGGEVGARLSEQRDALERFRLNRPGTRSGNLKKRAEAARHLGNKKPRSCDRGLVVRATRRAKLLLGFDDHEFDAAIFFHLVVRAALLGFFAAFGKGFEFVRRDHDRSEVFFRCIGAAITEAEIIF